MVKLLRRPAGFSLIELLTVMAIIAILIGISIAALSGVMRKGGRDRAHSEIKAFESALESYKSDNGSYPSPFIAGAAGFSKTNDYVTAIPTSSGGQYQNSSAYLYEQLSGNTAASYTYGAATKPVGHVYYAFQAGELGNNKPGAGNPVYLKDPWGNSYGYFLTTVDSSGPTPVTYYSFNGAGQYDLWSTASDPSSPPTNMPSWITDWSN